MQAIEAFGRLDVLVRNAGVQDVAPLVSSATRHFPPVIGSMSRCRRTQCHQNQCKARPAVRRLPQRQTLAPVADIA